MLRFNFLMFFFLCLGFISLAGNETGEKYSAQIVQDDINLILIAGIVIIIAALIIVLLKLRHEKTKQEKLLQSIKDKLNKTQEQLLNQEKMAASGRLLAGIVHEIQNPLNFINNFSELTAELLNEYRSAPHPKEQEEILKQIDENINKINFHGKRAGSTIKSMLQHSRKDDIEKQTTDINQFITEYLNFAYHGYRSGNKNVPVKVERKLNPSLPQIKIIQQDLSRVLINLLNNSFDAIEQKAIVNLNGYEPQLILETDYGDDKIFIKVKDNGVGISEEIKSRIFEPFFTTKPAGAGTGLGLSISNDIILAHGGKIEVKTENKNYTEVIVELPILN